MPRKIELGAPHRLGKAGVLPAGRDILECSSRYRKGHLEGPALSVELDSYAQYGLETLEAILGPATVVVRSGGRWIDEEGAQHDKLHAHWRLATLQWELRS